MASTLSWSKGPALAKRHSHITTTAAPQRQHDLWHVVLAVSSTRFSSVMLESSLETTIFIFTTGKRRKENSNSEIQVKKHSTGRVSMSSFWRPENIVADLSVLSVSHWVEESIKTCTKLQSETSAIIPLFPERFFSQNWESLAFVPTLHHRWVET